MSLPEFRIKRLNNFLENNYLACVISSLLYSNSIVNAL